MTFLVPGSFLWLLAHDVRLNWRMLGDLFARWPASKRALITICGLGGLHLVALGGMVAVERSAGGFAGVNDITATLALGAALWMVSQGLLGASRALFQRSELELLLSSPLPVWKPVAVRAASVAASSFGSLAPFVLPVANVGAVRYGAEWLGLYLITAALALAGTAAGFVIAVCLFHAAGPRLARLVAQVAAAVIAGAFVLGVQIIAVLPDGASRQILTQLSWLASVLPEFGLSAAAASVLRGETAAILTFLVASAVSFLVALRISSGTFVRAALIAAGAVEGERGGRDGRPFRPGPYAALRVKERRVLVRDPNIIAQLGLQIIYTLPIVVILSRSPGTVSPALALAPLIVVLAAQISASLAWLSISGEDAPELISTAPLRAGWPEFAKLSAIALPLAAILTLPAMILFWIAPVALIYAALFGAMAAVSTALLNFWHPLPGNRRGMLRRHHQSKIVAIAEHSLALFWACATVMAMSGSPAASVPLVMIGLILWGFRPKKRGYISGRSAIS